MKNYIHNGFIFALLLPSLSGCVYHRQYVNPYTYNPSQINIRDCNRRRASNDFYGPAGIACVHLLAQQNATPGMIQPHSSMYGSNVIVLSRVSPEAYSSSKSQSKRNSGLEQTYNDTASSADQVSRKTLTSSKRGRSNVDTYENDDGDTVVQNDNTVATIHNDSLGKNTITTNMGQEFTTDTDPTGVTTIYNFQHDVVGTAKVNSFGETEFYNTNGEKVSSLE